MGNHSIKLTERAVADLPTTGRDYKVFDTQLPGFHVRVQPTGRKSYAVFYRNEDGKQRTITLGKVELLKAEQARLQARQHLVDVQNGADPSEARRQRRAVVTVAHLWEDYLAMHAQVRKKASSVLNDKILWRLHLEPYFGSSRVEAIKLKDLTAFLSAMSHKPGAANRCLALLSKMMSLAIEWELRPDNPCRRARRFPENRKERFLTAEEAVRLRSELDLEKDRGGATAILFLLLTGARRSEVLEATWNQFDLTEGASRWIVPREQLKGATRIRVDLRRPLSDEAAGLLRAWRRDAPVTSLSMVFPSRTHPSKFRSDLKDVWDRVRGNAGLADVRLHDLRHSFASAAVNAGMSLHVIGKALGHSDVRTTERYAHVHDDSVRGVAEAVSRSLGA